MGRYLYKLTDEYGNTKNNTHWDVGVKHEIAKELRDCTIPLCSSSYIHAYENPLIAVFMNPAHADFKPPILWLATGWVSRREGMLKCGCFSLRTIKKLPLPVLSITQRVKIGIHCALFVYTEPTFVEWAKNWLAGVDRTAAAAAAAAPPAATRATAFAAAAYTATAAAYAAATAFAATRDAARAAAAAYTATDRIAATRDAYAAYAAADRIAAAAAVAAADAATHVRAAQKLNLVKIIKRVMKEEKNA
jgi:hypothetical protein